LLTIFPPLESTRGPSPATTWAQRRRPRHLRWPPEP
jgi:hypothetical protein